MTRWILATVLIGLAGLLVLTEGAKRVKIMYAGINVVSAVGIALLGIALTSFVLLSIKWGPSPKGIGFEVVMKEDEKK